MFRFTIIIVLSAMLLSACAGSQTQAGQGPELATQMPFTKPTTPVTPAPEMPTIAMPAAATPAAEMQGQGFASKLPDLGQAPELTNDTWINSDHPLRLANLHGKVVLIEMWTFGCYNCQNTLPAVKYWYSRYADQGLVIIGNHYPEFSYESDLANLKDAVQRAGILYPVAQDNEGLTWRAYHNLYWPTLYLIDKRGHLRYTHIGEGAYDTTEQAIQSLLAEKVE